MKNAHLNIQTRGARAAHLAQARIRACLPMALAVGMALLTGEALAVLPADPGQLLPDSIAAGADGFTAGFTLVEMGLKIASVTVGAVIALGAGYSMYNAFSNKKSSDDSSGFASAVFGGLLLVAVGVGLAIGGYTYANGAAAAILGTA